MNLSSLSRHQGLGIAALRIVVGVVFAAHGWQKLNDVGLETLGQYFAGMGIPMPEISAALATFTELIGGVALIVGAFTRYAAIPLAITMAVAVFHVHFDGGLFLSNDGFEYALVLMIASLTLATTGSGALSVDGFLERPKQS